MQVTALELPSHQKNTMVTTYSTRVRAPTNSVDCEPPVYDVATLKLPPGRGVEADSQRDVQQPKVQKNNIISCNSLSLIGTLNVRTIREQHKRLELVNRFINSGVKILGIQEHRIVHQEDIKIHQFKGGVTLISASAWRNGRGASMGGVGVMVSKEAYAAVSYLKIYGNRILTASFDGNPRLTVITVYSPTEAATDEDAESFHNSLRQAISDVPSHHLLLVVGDFNARLSKRSYDDPGWYYHQTTNRNGELLLDTLLEGNLEASNHRFRKKPGKQWTFLSDGTLTKSHIDYILIRKKWRNSLKNTEPYNFFSSVGSDHRAVICKVKLSLRKTKTPARRVIYDYNPLKTDTALQEQYSVEVRNKFSCLTEEMATEDESNVTLCYEKLVDAIEHANKTLLQKRPRKKWDDPTADPRVTTSRDNLIAAKVLYHLTPTDDTRTEVADKKEELKKNYQLVEEELLKKKIEKVQDTADRCKNKESWKLVNEVTGRKATNCGLIAGGGPRERLQNWEKHFTKLLGQPPQVEDDSIVIDTIHDTLDIDVDPFTSNELATAKKQITEGKAFGDDGIAPEVMKRVDIDDIILDFCNKALINGEIPDQWKQMNIVPVPKKGDLTKTGNYRGIALTSIVSKTLNRMVLNRIKPSIEKILRIHQNGFRTGRSTTSHILGLRRILEGAKAKNLSAVMTFIDFRKAFDSIHRGILMKILRAYGIPDTIVNLIERMYTGTMAKVLTTDGLTAAFLILAGVMQGDTLAPYLFVIVIDYIMSLVVAKGNYGFTISPARSRRYPAEKITDADFADDLALLTDTLEEAQQMLRTLEEVAKTVGLTMNESKTKYLSVNLNSEEEDQVLTGVSGVTIERVNDFVYLGSWIANTEHDFRVRKAKAWASCHQMKKIWTSNLRQDLKKRLFVATVESILLYGSETWTITKSMAKRIDGCYTRMLRMALNINWKERRTNREVYGDLPRVTTKIQERRMKLAGHVVRHDDLVANKLVLWEPTHGRRSRGRPPLTYVDVLLGDAEAENANELRALMNDRLLWRRTIAVRSTQPP